MQRVIYTALSLGAVALVASVCRPSPWRSNGRSGRWSRRIGGVALAPPLEVRFPPGAVKARFIRLQSPSWAPIALHLDEVEVYGTADAKKNIALGKPAEQSSVSEWSLPHAAPAAGNRPLPTRFIVQRGRMLAADLKRSGVDVAAGEKVLAEVALKLQRPGGSNDQTLYFQARSAVRAMAFSNPLLKFDKIVLVNRFTQETYPDICLNHMPWVSRPGGDICILTNPFAPDFAKQSVRTLIDGRLGFGHVHGMDLWWDGSRVVFGWAKAKSAEPVPGFPGRLGHEHRLAAEPTHLFEMNIDGSRLKQLTAGPWADLDPTYLPNGNIAFVSERCGMSLQCNEWDKDETSCNLYVMKPDGSGIRRLSANKDGDYLPHTRDDGTIGYCRWEYQERGLMQIQSIWYIRPDGADAWCKQHLDSPLALENARSIPGSTKMAAIAAGHHTLNAGPLCILDARAGNSNSAGISIVTPGVSPPEGPMSGTPVPSGGVVDYGGYYMTPWPLSKKYFLVSYTYGRQTDARAGHRHRARGRRRQRPVRRARR